MVVKVEKIITTKQEHELDIMGATLLSIDEAEKLPLRLREYKGWWWLRSPGCNLYSAASVIDDGTVYHYGYLVIDNDVALRPALLINLASSNLKVGDCFIFGDKEFEIISETLAFCKGDIGEHCFRGDYKTEDANDYEKSDVKKFIDNWFGRFIQCS